MKRLNKIIALLMAFLLASSLWNITAFADDLLPEETVAERRIEISTADEFLEFAEDCLLDSYSFGLTAELTADIDLTGRDFNGIASFSGTFYGGGHTISGINIERKGSNTGFFRTIKEGAMVEGLRLEGKVTGEGNGISVGGLVGLNQGTILNSGFEGDVEGLTAVGGIAGTNGSTGYISACDFSGSVCGEHQVGGISGDNSGYVSLCENKGSINCEARTETSSMSETTDFSLSDQLKKLNNLDNDDILDITDIGGITGANSNLVCDCKNTGEVGYPHIGYNVGGVAGRSSGFVDNCVNKADVYGRNDVGGIVGQLEPYAVWDLSDSSLTKLKELFETLDNQTEAISNKAGSFTDSLANSLNSLLTSMEEAVSAFATLETQYKNGAEKTYNTIMGSIKQQNIDLSSEESKVILEELERVATAMDWLIPDTSDLISALENIRASVTAVKDSVSGTEDFMEDISAVTETVSEILNTGLKAAENPGLADDYLEDISVTDAYNQDRGAVSNCTEKGIVNGDTGVGGIVGTVDFEISFDLESELGLSDYLFGNARYQVFAVVRDCESKAEIELKKENAGGIAGNQSFGAIVNCASSGSAYSASGSCLGGIAGESEGTIMKCYSGLTLSGEKYIGGVAGLGKNVIDCVSRSILEKDGEYMGGISGWAEGTLQNNIYTGRQIGGVDGVDLDGSAVWTSYEEMTKLEGIPDSFKKIEINFIDENGEVIKTIEVGYGETISEEDFPVIEKTDDAYWVWDESGLENICCSMEISGSWKKAITTIFAKVGDVDFLAEGIFDDKQELLVTEITEELGTEVCSILEDRENMSLSGAYCLEVSDASGEHLIRLKGTGLRIWKVTDEGYTELTCQEDGSYTIFTLEIPSEIVVFLTDETQAVPVWILIAAAVLVLGGTAALLIAHNRRKKGKVKNNEK